MKNILPALLFILCFMPCAKAQLSGGVYVVTNPNVTIPLGQQCTTLTAAITGGAQTSAYTVNQIAYNPPAPFNADTIVLYHTDDLWSQPITIPFNFCFWGVAHNQLVIGSNGEVSFNISNGGIFETWSLRLPLHLPADQRNVIMAPWQDLDPTYQGVIKYTTGGTAPNRFFAVSWNNIAMFGDSGSVDTTYCSRDDHQTSMVVMYETSNNIDIYIQNKSVTCADLSGGTYWNGGLAMEGITNPGGTALYMVPGRSATQWTAQNDAWRFTPAGAPNFTTTWIEAGTQVGNTDTLVVCPTAPTVYVMQVIYTLCDNSTVTIDDTVNVGFTFALNNPVITYPGCTHPGSLLAQVTDTAGSLTYSWSNGETGPLDSALTPGIYGLTVTNSIGQSVTSSYLLAQNLQGAINGATIISPGCGSAGSINLTNSPGNNITDTYSWSNGQTSANNTGLVAGTYLLTITDTAGCSATASYVLQQDTPINITGALVYAPCANNSNGHITLQVSGGSNGAYAYLWSNLATTETISGLNSGPYSVTVTGPQACSVSATYLLGPPLSVNEVLNHPHCVIPGNVITMQTSGGTVPYTYHWTSNLSNTDSLIIPAGGIYAATVSDANGCSITPNSVIADSTRANAISITGDSIFCSNIRASYTANIIFNGYSARLLWKINGVIVDSLSTTYNDSAVNNGDVITCTLIDSCGLPVTVVSNSITIHITAQDSTLRISNDTIRAITCADSSNGYIGVQVSGGSGSSYNYLWSNGQTTPAISNLSAGVYQLTITGQGDCQVSGSFAITQLYPVSAQKLWLPWGCPYPTSIVYSGVGGTQPYTYQWAPNVSNTATVNNPAAGNYSVTITDAHGCTASFDTIINTPIASTISISGDSLFCSPPSTTYTAVITTGGGVPNYIWRINGTYSGTPYVDSIFTPTSLSNGDVITCILTTTCTNPTNDTSNGITIHIDQAPLQPLCLVSADSAGTANVVMWEKVNKPATDSFFIYRTYTPNTNYAQIAAIPRDSLSEYQDNTANPELSSYRYKINLKDTCGNYSPLSNYIQTIFMQYIGGLTFVWTPYLVENGPNPVIQYNLLGDTDGTGNWYVLATTVSDTTLSDPGNPYDGILNYRVQAVLNTTCTPTRNIATGLSNIVTILPNGIKAIPAGQITLMPNPAHNQFEIVNANPADNFKSLVLLDQLGNRLMVPYSVSGVGKISTDISSVSTGLYYVFINYDNSSAVLKVVKY